MSYEAMCEQKLAPVTLEDEAIAPCALVGREHHLAPTVRRRLVDIGKIQPIDDDAAHRGHYTVVGPRIGFATVFRS
jgi:hypothetical protein